MDWILLHADAGDIDSLLTRDCYALLSRAPSTTLQHLDRTIYPAVAKGNSAQIGVVLSLLSRLQQASGALEEV